MGANRSNWYDFSTITGPTYSDYSSAITGIPHAVVDTLIYKKFVIPPGAILIPNIASIHQDTNLYPNPQNFDPSRFHKPIAIGEEKLSDSHRERDHYHFGFGRRHCPGSHIAEAALYIAIVRILWAFDIGVPQGSSAPRMEEQRCTVR